MMMLDICMEPISVAEELLRTFTTACQRMNVKMFHLRDMGISAKLITVENLSLEEVFMHSIFYVFSIIFQSKGHVHVHILIKKVRVLKSMSKLD